MVFVAIMRWWLVVLGMVSAGCWTCARGDMFGNGSLAQAGRLSPMGGEDIFHSLPEGVVAAVLAYDEPSPLVFELAHELDALAADALARDVPLVALAVPASCFPSSVPFRAFPSIAVVSRGGAQIDDRPDVPSAVYTARRAGGAAFDRLRVPSLTRLQALPRLHDSELGLRFRIDTTGQSDWLLFASLAHIAFSVVYAYWHRERLLSSK